MYLKVQVSLKGRNVFAESYHNNILLNKHLKVVCSEEEEICIIYYIL